MARTMISMSDEVKERIQRIAERDQIPIALVVRELIDMSLDARENWQRAPKLQLVEEVTE